MNDRLRRGGLCLVPRTEIFRLVTKSSTVRERAYMIKEQRLERGSFRKRLGGAISTAIGADVSGLHPAELDPIEEEIV